MNMVIILQYQPSVKSATAILMPLLKALASSDLWNVNPNRLSSVIQWWNLGFGLKYFMSLLSTQSSTTWNKQK